MDAVDLTNLPAHRSRQEIFAHPKFPEARNALIDAMLKLYEHEPFLNRLLLQVGRNVVVTVLMCLHAGAKPDDPSTLPTLKLLKQSMAAFGLASPRRIADLISRLMKTGYLEQAPWPGDGRIRILQPTEKMIEHDLNWLVSHYVPLQVLYPDPGYAPIMGRDRAFQRTHRLVGASLFPHAVQLLARNPLMTQFMIREAGIMTLIKLLELCGPDARTTRAVSYSDIGARFGVSRTQVRKLLEDAQASGLVHLSNGGRVQLTPALTEAFDRFIADTMEGHDLVYRLAQRTLAEATEPRAKSSAEAPARR